MGYIGDISEGYNHYIDKVSDVDMAASLESCSLLLRLCEGANIAADFGSGFSSYALREFKRIYKPDLEVWSVDTEEEWLTKSKEFSYHMGVDTSNFRLWGDRIADYPVFDVVFFDMGRTKERPQYLRFILDNMIHHGSYVLLDDVHKTYLKEEYKIIFEGYLFKKVDVEVETTNYSGRTKRFCDLYTGIKKKVNG